MALNTTITSNIATSTRIIHTPWPVVLGQLVLSLVVALYSIIKGQPSTSTPPSSCETTQNWVLWLFNLGRLAGALVILIQSIMARNFLERGNSVAIICGNMLMSCTAVSGSSIAILPNTLASLASVVCLILYIVNGAIAYFEDSTHSILTIVERGCVDYWAGLAECQSTPYMQRVPESTTGDTLLTVSWYIGAILGGPMVFSSAFLSCIAMKAVSEKFKRLFQRILAVGLLLGGTLCVGAAVADAQSYTVDFNDCSNATQIPLRTVYDLDGGRYYPCNVESIVFPGSTTGFWTEWVGSEVEVVEGAFTW